MGNKDARWQSCQLLAFSNSVPCSRRMLTSLSWPRVVIAAPRPRGFVFVAWDIQTSPAWILRYCCRSIVEVPLRQTPMYGGDLQFLPTTVSEWVPQHTVHPPLILRNILLYMKSKRTEAKQTFNKLFAFISLTFFQFILWRSSQHTPGLYVNRRIIKWMRAVIRIVSVSNNPTADLSTVYTADISKTH